MSLVSKRLIGVYLKEEMVFFFVIATGYFTSAFSQLKETKAFCLLVNCVLIVHRLATFVSQYKSTSFIIDPAMLKSWQILWT